ncbi:hypothetical protein [Flavisolibacter ginsenosidimutans]|uniref:Uncharacterized protein n=1 Tax=Flavisolibacter ginsenosidimutans TaxID=661481 RepID=A0A5B8UJG2_9BACT|nr:hypothetical protein [Flavisolibacter ginsenosidimutans]QEC56708.1 hypothetical protein FSB75_12640 [Flavisolibacter ginsenosidimutans]
MYPQALQQRLERAVIAYKSEHQEKPSLLQISRTDYNTLLPHESPNARCGLAIYGVTVVGLDDVRSGDYHLVS